MSQSTIRRRFVAGMLVTGVMLTSLVSTVPGAGAATAANENYVRSLYLDLLDRTTNVGDDAGVEYWADLLDSGRSRTEVARAIQNATDEYYGAVVQFSYQRYLDRSADPGGFRYFVDGWKSKQFTLETVTSVLVGSREYYNRNGRNDGDFVDGAYFDILGREPDAQGKAYFVGIAATQGRGTVARVLVTSTENRRREVRFAIDTYLGRETTSAEVSFYVDMLRDGVRREEIDVLIVGSDEYYDNNS